MRGSRRQAAAGQRIARSARPGRLAGLLAVAGAAVVALSSCSGSGVSGGAGTASASATRTASAAGTASMSASPGATASASGSPAVRIVPLRVVRRGQAAYEIVPVYVDGRGPYRFLLDTGSTVSSVSQSLAKDLNLPKSGSTAQIRGVNTSQKVPVARIKSWKLGQVSLAPEHVAVLDLSKTAGGVVGLLGSDELSRFSRVTLDFRHDQLRVQPGSG